MSSMWLVKYHNIESNKVKSIPKVIPLVSYTILFAFNLLFAIRVRAYESWWITPLLAYS